MVFENTRTQKKERTNENKQVCNILKVRPREFFYSETYL